MLKVNDLLRSQKNINNFTISPYSSILSALIKMSDEKIGVLAIVDEGEIVGIIEENAFLKLVYKTPKLDLDRPIYSIMEMKVLYVTKNFTLKECLALMSSERIFYLPVLEDCTFIGMISIYEVSAKLVEYEEFIIDNLSQYITGNLVFNTSTSLPSNVKGILLNSDKLKDRFKEDHAGSC